jgi:hypothetical protein
MKMTKIVKGFQKFRAEDLSGRGTFGKSRLNQIYENSPGDVITADQKEVLDKALKDGKIDQEFYDRITKDEPELIPIVIDGLQAGRSYVGYEPGPPGSGFSAGSSGTNGTAGSPPIASKENFWVKASRAAGKGEETSFGYSHSASDSELQGGDYEIKKYFDPEHGTSGRGRTVGDTSSVPTFPEDLPNSAGGKSTTRDITDFVTKRYPADVKNKLEVPDYKKLGEPAFTGSAFFANVREKLSVDKKRRKIINSLKENGIVSPSVDLEKENVLVAVRMPSSVKEKYANDFTDLFFLFTGEDRNVEIFRGSTTPSPAFRYKDWYDFYTRIGMVGLIKQNGSYILDDGTYNFKVSSGNSKNDFLKTSLLIQAGPVNLHRYGTDADSIAGAKETYNYKPSVKLDPTQTPPIFIAPALAVPQEASSLDATTSGDQVIRKSEDFRKILKAGSNGLKYILKTLPEDFTSDEEEK